MPLPKGFKKNLKITSSKIGQERRQELLDDIANQGTFLPRGVLYEDMDKSFVDYIENGLNVVIDGKKVPVIFLTIQRWSEFSKTWEFADQYKDITLPFITIVRQPDVQVGTNQAGLWNIPGRPTYTYVKMPTLDKKRKGIDVYKIPQPTSVDITYEIRIFCNRMRELNKLNKSVQQAFRSRQHYIYPNGHPMPITLESIADESQIDDLQNRRFYVQLFELKLAGYILDEDEFEVIPAINRLFISEEVEDDITQPRVRRTINEVENIVNYSFIFRPRTTIPMSIVSDYDINFTTITNISNITDIIFKVNGDVVTLPFTINAGDTLTIEITKNFYSTGSFILIGSLI